jgi:penicillin amidase
VRRILLYMLLAIVVIAIGAFGFGWWIIHRALPQVDGTQELAELKSEVTVRRDSFGVPHISAQSAEDLFTAQGYVMAQDRLWQMDLVRRGASGRLSEIVGPATLEIDRSFRRLGLSQAADRDAALLDPQERVNLEAFARGVNRFIDEHRGRLPVEFVLLRYEPEHWRPADTLLVVGYMFQTLTSSWRWDLNRLDVSAKLGKERAQYFYNDVSPYDHPIVGGQVDTVPFHSANASTHIVANASPIISAPAIEPGVDPEHPAPPAERSLLWNFAQDALVQFDEQIRASFGSNNWVVDGTHTASGKPLLANDTHLQLGMPDIWYMAHLSMPGWNAEGFTLPGVPGIVIGHNDQIAWGFTNNGADVQDLYEETFDPANPMDYRVNGNWVRTETRTELIKVKGAPTETLNITVTRHGPLMARRGDTGFALKWTATEPGGLANSYYKIQFAHNWQEFREALRDASGPGQNIVYADVTGHIGFVVGARIPMRNCAAWPPPKSPLPSNTPCGAAPLPGDTDAYEWSGYIPFDELPQALDPPGGIIATANSRVTGPGYTHYVTSDWAPPWRTDRIYTLLGQPTKFQPDDFNAIQNDIVQELNVILAKELVKSAAITHPHDDRTAQLIHLLENWDGRMTTDSVQATFVERTRRALERNLLRQYVGETMPNYPLNEVFLDRVLRERPPIWLPSVFHTYDELLISSADLAVAELTSSTNETDITKWVWGKHNKLSLAHPLGQSGILARILSRGPYEQSGADGAIKAMSQNHGPSMRMVADTSDWDRSLMEITTGESGQLSSAHYDDQFPLWFGGKPLPAPFTDAAVQRATQHTLHLVPAKH